MSLPRLLSLFLIAVIGGLHAATAETALQTVAPMGDRMRGPGRFADEVATESSDALDRFIAFTGRRSVRG